MSSTTLYRLSGISLLLGSTLGIVGAVIGIFGNDPTGTMTIVGAAVSFVGASLGLMGLPGIYAWQARRAGVLGLIGIALLLMYIIILGSFGSALNALILPYFATNAPALVKTAPVGLAIFYTIGILFGVIGGILLGIATIRAAILPRWAGALLIAGVSIQAVGDFAQSPIGDVGFLLVMLGFIGLSSALLTQQHQARVAAEVAVGAA